MSAEGIAMDKRKIEVVKNWVTSRSLKDVRAFVGFCSYYRRYIKNFSALARPLQADEEERAL